MSQERSAQKAAAVNTAAGSCATCNFRAVSSCRLLTDRELAVGRHRRVFQRRTSICEEGEQLGSVFVLRSGVVSVARSLSGGRRQVLDFLMAGDTLGLTQEDGPRTTIRVLEDAEVCQLPSELFKVESRPAAFVRGLIAILEGRLSRIHNHIVLLGKLNAEERVVAFLLRYRENRLRLQTLQSRVDLPMTRKDLADHLGMAAETVSRVLSWLADRQLILHIPDGIRILDLEALSLLQERGCHQPTSETEPPVQPQAVRPASSRAKLGAL